MKISLSVALFESMQVIRQDYVAMMSPETDLMPLGVERQRLVEHSKTKAHVSFKEEDGTIEIVIDDKLVSAVLVIVERYAELASALSSTLKVFIPHFEKAFAKVAELAKVQIHEEQ